MTADNWLKGNADKFVDNSTQKQEKQIAFTKRFLFYRNYVHYVHYEFDLNLQIYLFSTIQRSKVEQFRQVCSWNGAACNDP